MLIGGGLASPVISVKIVASSGLSRLSNIFGLFFQIATIITSITV